MAAHVMVQDIDPQTPATLSHKILTGFLRKEMGFSGLILSDDLRMDAIALHYNRAPDALVQASFDALHAGCDILLACHSIEKEMDIVDALASKLKSDKEFLQNMSQKAYHIYGTLT